jgi:hypothetical protein
MKNNISNKQRASFVGVLMFAAYAMLTYSATKSIALGVITDFVSGLAVIGIPFLLFPLFNTGKNKKLNKAYIISRFFEGLLILVGGVLILFPQLREYRELVYSDVQIYFFILGALFFYMLFYRTRAIPIFISVWGIVATILLLATTILKLFGIDSQVLQMLFLPIALNELFLAVWLIVKGFNFSADNDK